MALTPEQKTDLQTRISAHSAAHLPMTVNKDEAAYLATCTPGDASTTGLTAGQAKHRADEKASLVSRLQAASRSTLANAEPLPTRLTVGEVKSFAAGSYA
jgi:hypothetical protein